MLSSKLFIRSMASAAKAKPPVQLFGVDGTYASALYLAAAEDSSVEKAFTQLGQIENLVKNDAKVQLYFTNPVLTQDDREIVVKTVGSALNLDPTVTNFLKVLADNNRLANFGGIYKQFTVLNDAHSGIVIANITSAKPLDSKILKRLQQSIAKSKYVGANKTLQVKNQVNPDILGGLIVEVADQTVDLSISSKVSKLNQALSEAV